MRKFVLYGFGAAIGMGAAVSVGLYAAPRAASEPLPVTAGGGATGEQQVIDIFPLLEREYPDLDALVAEADVVLVGRFLRTRMHVLDDVPGLAPLPMTRAWVEVVEVIDAAIDDVPETFVM